MIEIGTVVRSMAGHDKHRFYVVLQSSDQEVKIADGKERKLEKPKLKNRKHVQPTKTKLDIGLIMSDKSLRKFLQPFNATKGGDTIG